MLNNMSVFMHQYGAIHAVSEPKLWRFSFLLSLNFGFEIKPTAGRSRVSEPKLSVLKFLLKSCFGTETAQTRRKREIKISSFGTETFLIN